VLRVALDARCLQQHPLGGVGRSTRAVVAAVRNDVDLLLLTDPHRPPVATDVPQRSLRCRVPTKAAWLQLAVPPALRGFDGIFHCPWYGLPFRQPVPMVVTIYDLSFEHGGIGFERHQRLAYRAQARWAARTARCVLTGSQAVRSELIARYGVAPDRVAVQPSPLDPALLDVDPARVEALRERLGVVGRYVVAIGGAERRRADLALESWPRVRARVPGVTLVVLGRLEASHLPAGVVSAGVVDDADWAAALYGADALLYPTELEGFGYPALEAMALGTPIVCGRVGSLPEVVGDAGSWFDAHDAGAVASAVIRVLTDSAYASQLGQRGRAHTRNAADLAELRGCIMRAYEAAAT
jgi:glycosyltransferase involved in cell wall biosynthesis